MHRNVKRAYPAAQNTVEFLIVHVGERDEVAHHQRQTPIIVLDVERIAHTRGHLVNEAEDAMVVAGPGFGNDTLIQRETEWFPVLLVHVKHRAFAICAQDLHGKTFLRGQRLIVDLVDDRFAGDLFQLVAFFEPEPFGNGAGSDVDNGTGQCA